MNLFRPFVVAAALLFLSFLFYLLCLNHVDINEVGIAYDSTNGTIARQHPGWHITHPLVRATTISLLPFRVEINAGTTHINQRVLNVKLVEFVPEHLDEFIATEGFHYMSNGQPYVFAPYVFSGRSYPFIRVIQ